MSTKTLFPGVRFTYTEQELMNILCDGKRHKIKDLHSEQWCPDERKALTKHMVMIRKKINPLGYDVICEFAYRCTHYRLVRTITSGE